MPPVHACERVLAAFSAARLGDVGPSRTQANRLFSRPLDRVWRMTEAVMRGVRRTPKRAKLERTVRTNHIT